MTAGISAGEGLAAVRAVRTKRELVDEYVALQTQIRRLQSRQYDVLAELETMVEDGTVGLRRTYEIVADEARLERKDVRLQVKIASEVTSPISYTGERLSPKYEHVAAVVRSGVIGIEHVTVIRRFFKNLPRKTALDARVYAEQQLAAWSAGFRPDEVAKLAVQLLLILDEDGSRDDDVDRQRKRHVTVHKQGRDKMVSGSFCLTPEAAAYLEAYLAKFARKGMCNPAYGEPTITGEPTQDSIDADDRTYGQRCHDALLAMMRHTLMSGELGRHRGLPVTVVLTADIQDLDTGSRPARTGGGLAVPISDLLRLSGHARHFLAMVFGDAVPVALRHGRDRRIATDGQRLMLHAVDRGCTSPGCDRGAYFTQAHHAVTDWVDGGRTDIDELTCACDIHHALVGSDRYQWRTRKNRLGYTEWIPPKTVDPQQRPRVNHFHHPERRLRAG